MISLEEFKKLIPKTIEDVVDIIRSSEKNFDVKTIVNDRIFNAILNNCTVQETMSRWDIEDSLLYINNIINIMDDIFTEVNRDPMCIGVEFFVNEDDVECVCWEYTTVPKELELVKYVLNNNYINNIKVALAYKKLITMDDKTAGVPLLPNLFDKQQPLGVPDDIRLDTLAESFFTKIEEHANKADG